jgi:hypothetical protein
MKNANSSTFVIVQIIPRRMRSVSNSITLLHNLQHILLAKNTLADQKLCNSVTAYTLNKFFSIKLKQGIKPSPADLIIMKKKTITFHIPHFIAG